MKHFIKFALILSLVLVILGSICCTVSFGIGFNYSDFWQDVEEGKYSFGPISEVGEAIWRNGDNWRDDGVNWKSASTNEYAFPWNGEGDERITGLDLDVYYGKVRMEESNSNEVQVIVEYRKKNHRRKVEAYNDGGILKIEETGSKRSRNNDSTRITIGIPSEMMEEEHILEAISLRQDAGAIYTDIPLRAEKISINVNAGECLAYEKLTALREFSADVGAGEIDLQAVEAPEVTLNADVGQSDTETITADDLYIDCGIGSIDAQVCGKEQDYNYEVSCSMGEVSIGDHDFHAISAKKEIDNSADKTMRVDCNIGQVDVSFDD